MVNVFPNQSTKYYYPDGTVSVSEPNDGQVFFVWDVNAYQPKEVWQWDTKNQQWLDITASSGPSVKEMDDNFNLAEEFERMIQEGAKQKKCECGSESVGSNVHSSWCQKWSSDS